MEEIKNFSELSEMESIIQEEKENSKFPFFTVPSKIFSLGLNPYEISILIYLLMRADNKSRTCWPSEKSMARECGMVDRTVRKVVHSLEEKGLISVKTHY